MTASFPLPRGGVIFAPLEGITDPLYRQTVLDICPDWDVLSCDFLRVPAAGHYPTKHLLGHIGQRFYADPHWRKHTLYQILAAENSFTADISRHLQELDIQWLDLNIGCPSKTVCKHGGGSFLLTMPDVLRRIVRDIRQNYKGFFSCKIRSGWADGNGVSDTVKLLNDEGVQLITVHGRTREQMYKEPADWKWISEAVKASQVPVIGNGDIWQASDIGRMINETGCHGVMVARGALKTPWMATLYKKNLPDTEISRREMIRSFLMAYKDHMLADGVSERGILKQSKSVSRFMFDDLPEGATIRRQLLLSQDSATFFHLVQELL